MNLVVVARQPEVGERAAETIQRLTGRHPSRTLIVLSADPDGPPWLEARIQAHCVLPREDAPETCTELIFLTAGGETGRHLTALVEPLLVHDLPVTVWWPGEPPLDREPARDLLEGTDRLVIDGSVLVGRRAPAAVPAGRAVRRVPAAVDPRLRARPPVALAGGDRVGLRPAGLHAVPRLDPPDRGDLRDPRRDRRPGHDQRRQAAVPRRVARLAARACGSPRRSTPVELKSPAPPRPRPGDRAPLHRGLAGRLRGSGGEVAVVMRPIASTMPAGTTLRVEILAERRGSELRTDVTAEADNVHVHTWLDGVQAIDRTFKAPRRGEVDLLGEALETGGRDPLAVDTIRKAAQLIGPRALTHPHRCTEAATDAHRSRPARAARAARSGGRGGQAAAIAIADGIRPRSTRAASRTGSTTGGSAATADLPRRSARRHCGTGSTGQRVHVWWGDDRFVPADHPASNVSRWSRSCS